MSESPQIKPNEYPERIYIRERQSGGGYYTGVLSAEWMGRKEGNAVEYARADALRASRDKLAGLLREAIDNIPEHEWINYTDGLYESIKAALAEVGREGGSTAPRCSTASEIKE